MTSASAVFACLVVSIGSAFGQTGSPATGTVDTAQEAVIFDRIENKIQFDEDGTGLRDTSAVIRIQSQAGVQAFGQLVFGYSAATENLEIQYVRVRKPDGRVIETPSSTAQDFAPDILKEAPMYSDYRQRHISVSSLQPGDTLEYHTVVHVTTPLAPHQFWYEHVFPKDAVVREDRLEIDVPKHREIKLKSPKQKYEMQEVDNRRSYVWDIKDFMPERKHENDQAEDLAFSPDVQLSSFTDWRQIAIWYGQLQGDRVTADDSVRKKAEELSRGATTPAEKARRLYNYVALNIRYVSLSFGVGRLQPHAASEVLQYGYGDCKDKHTLLQALLRAEGIESYPVLINSFRKLDPDVPSPAQFDHLITAAKLGRDFTWLDSTEEVAPYGLIAYPLRNKQALLASQDANAGLVRTSADAPVKNVFNMTLDGSFTETGAFEASLDLTAQGDSDMPLRGAFRRTSQADWVQVFSYVLRSWGLPSEASEIHVDPLEDTSKPFHLTCHLRQENYFRVPSSFTDFHLLPPIGFSRLPGVNTKNPSELLDVGPAVERTYRAHVQFPDNYTVSVPTDVKMSRDFGEYSSSFVLKKNVLDAERHFVLKVSELPAARRYDYESFRSATSSETQQLLSCSISAPSGTHIASVSPSTSPAELQKLGAAALERRDFSTAADLLKRAVAGDARRKDAWDQLGEAYAGLNQHDDAVAAFRKQIEIDPNHKSAHSDLAGELQHQGKLDDAVAAYRQQLEIFSSDKLTHKNLGLLLAQMKRDDQARVELEAAAAIPPVDQEVTLALAQVYTRTGDSAKAAALMSAVTGGSSAAGSDVFAAALPDNLNPDQAIREARDTLDQIGDHFDSGEYDRLPPSAFSAMSLVALSWSRIGWAKFLQGEMMESMQFLNSAWLLSQSGVVANRFARMWEKEGQRDRARHMFALAAAIGGPDAASSREQAGRLSSSPQAADQEISQASEELVKMRTVKLPAALGKGSAQFALIFDSSSMPSRAEYLSGDVSMKAASDKLREKEFPVRFPDVSSLKIVRRATLSCDPAGCVVVLEPIESLSSLGAATPSH